MIAPNLFFRKPRCRMNETDPDRLKRRETIRKQFGFTQRATSATHSASGKSDLDGVKLPPLPTRTDGEAMETSAETAGPRLTPPASGEPVPFLLSSAPLLKRCLHHSKLLLVASFPQKPRHTRLRRDADNAEKVYEEAVRNLDRTRCQWKRSSLSIRSYSALGSRPHSSRSVRARLLQPGHFFQLPILHQSSTRSFKIHEGLDPSLELRALIRQARTGPFHPSIERFSLTTTTRSPSVARQVPRVSRTDGSSRMVALVWIFRS